MLKKEVKGFTLIELLIVVAIIAILAAIAVPNFLEAQTRSKVSRARSDMRSLAVAMETYRVDCNAYPFSTSIGIGLASTVTRGKEIADLKNGMSSYPLGVVPNELTTPLAYLSAIPNDYFKEAGFGVTSSNQISLPTDHPWHRYGLATTGAIQCAVFFSYDPATWPANWQPRPDLKGKKWLLNSLGPDRTEDVIMSYTMADYDPSNGTVSKGDISRVGP